MRSLILTSLLVLPGLALAAPQFGVQLQRAVDAWIGSQGDDHSSSLPHPGNPCLRLPQREGCGQPVTTSTISSAKWQAVGWAATSSPRMINGG